MKQILWSKVLPEKLINSQLIKKFCAFCGTYRSVTVLADSLRPDTFKPVHALPFYVFKIYFINVQLMHSNI